MDRYQIDTLALAVLVIVIGVFAIYSGGGEQLDDLRLESKAACIAEAESRFAGESIAITATQETVYDVFVYGVVARAPRESIDFVCWTAKDDFFEGIQFTNLTDSTPILELASEREQKVD